MDPAMLYDVALALGLGLLVGLQREWASKPLGGIRTFPLIAILGVLCGALAESFGGWIVAGAFVALAATVVVGDLARLRGGDDDGGVTTEIAILVMFAVGCALPAGYTTEAIVVAGCVAVLLHWKRPLHRLVERMGEKDLRAVIRLTLLGLVILPALPNETYGPYDVLNPFRIWLMVVLIVGISLAAYVAYRLLGARRGSLLGGVLGGLISSTATTVTYARRTKGHAGRAPAATAVIMLASVIVFVRVVVEVGLVAPGILADVAPPLGLMMGFMGVLCIPAVLLMGDRAATREERDPPTELTAAVVFGLLYAIVIFLVAVAKEHFGRRGVYVVAALSGLTDMDAVTLSTANLVSDGRLDVESGWRVILVSSMANVVFKGAVVATLGHPRLLARIALLFGLALAGGATILWLWPA
jgi:uncharacterized membrane protein (DUF4010 family)